jgi:hypothetical protein
MSARKQAAGRQTRRPTWLVIALGVLLAALVFGSGALFAQGGGTITVVAPDPSQDPAAGPSGVPIMTPATGGVSAAASNPPSQPGYGQTITASWGWTVTSFQYASLQSNAWGDPPAGSSYGAALGTSTDTYSNSVNTVTGAFSLPGYWQVTVTATVTYSGSGDPQTGSASMAVVFPVFSLSITPASVYVPVGGTASATGIVVPADLVGYFSCTTANASVATVTAGTPTGGNVPLTVTGVQSGTTQLQGSLGSGPPATANVTVGTFSLTPQSPAICAGGVATPIHQTLLTAVLTDYSGNPQAGQQITFETSDGTVNPASAVTDSNGTATTTLTSSSQASDPNANPPVTYQATVTALASSQSAQAKVEFQPPQITLTAQPPVILLTQTSNLVVQLTWNQQPVPEHTITYSITGIWDLDGNQLYPNTQGTMPAGYGSVQGPSQTTDSTGTATAQYLPGTNYGTVEITAADTSVFFADTKLNPLAKFRFGVSAVVVNSISLNYPGQTAPTVSLTDALPAGGGPPQAIQAPEWVLNPATRNPAAFVRGNAFNMKVAFSGPGGASVVVQGKIIDDEMDSGKASSLKGTVTPEVIVGLNGLVGTTGNGTDTFTTKVALDNWVDVHLIEVQWQWQYVSDPGTLPWTNIPLPTKFVVYAVDQTPKTTTDTKNYVQLVDRGCTTAAGQASSTGGDPVFQALWQYVQTRNLYYSTPPKPMYWGPYASAGNYASLGQNNTVGLIVNGDGRCQAWAYLFSDLCRVQGIAVNPFTVTPPKPPTTPPPGYWLFLVNNLTLGPAQASPPAPNTQNVYQSDGMTWNAGIVAQGQPVTPGPPAGLTQPDRNTMWVGKTFSNHCMTYRDLNNNGIRDVNPTIEQIYDPSYGLGGYQQLIDWKVPALGAYVSFSRYPLPGGKTGWWMAQPKANALEITPPAAGFNLP